MNQSQNAPTRMNLFVRTSSAQSLFSAGLRHLAICCALLLPELGHCYTEVVLSSWVDGTVIPAPLTKSQTLRSFPVNTPIEAAWHIGTNGGNATGGIDAGSRVFGHAEVGTLRLFVYDMALSEVSTPYLSTV